MSHALQLAGAPVGRFVGRGRLGSRQGTGHIALELELEHERELDPRRGGVRFEADRVLLGWPPPAVGTVSTY